MEPLTGRVDLSNCDREPIHIPGRIQPIGFLVALTADWMIARTSDNVGTYLDGQSPTAMLGRPLSDFWSAEAIHTVRNRIALLRGPNSVERRFGQILWQGGPAFDIAVHTVGNVTLLEVEPSDPDEGGDAVGTVRSMMARLDSAGDFEAFFREGARQVRALTGFDRVMVYRFAADGSGEVVGEAVKSGIGSFKGLHYPAEDIPAQARELYRRNLFRIIADVDAVPVAVVPTLDENGAPLDLSMAILRAVSPIHLEYLRNMGVRASLSISIIVDNKLWGLFACHHHSPRCPGFERRTVAELFGEMFSMRLDSRERQEALDYDRRARDISDQLLTAVASNEAMLNDPDWIGEIIMHSIAADGIGVWINGNFACSGLTPPADEFARIVRALNAAATGRVFATDQIAKLVPEAASYAHEAAGMLSIPISRSPRDYVILFRSEMVRSVRWAGDPHKPVEFGPNGPRLTPRKSFETWTELVRGRAKAFTPAEMRVAETLRATLIEVVLRLSEEAASSKQQASERQELLIAELHHRVRNILGLIRGVVRQSRMPEGSVDDYIALVDGRIHALACAHNQITRDHWGPAPLKGLIIAEAGAYLLQGTDQLEVTGEDVLLNPTAYSTIALVLHELITNSAKYGALSIAQGRVRLSWNRDTAGDLHISWREVGGPPVKAPTRQGFGTTIIKRSVPYDLGGRSDLRYQAAGVEADIQLPAEHIAGTIASSRPEIAFEPHPPKRAEAPTLQVLSGKSVLLVEDSLIIALDAEDILRRLGASDVHTASNVESAFALLDETTPDQVMLDINLGGQTSFIIADRALRLGIPYCFATGYGEQAKLPEAHRSAIVVQKPYTLDNVARAMADH